ncbi:PREDICTED: LOW QUALITY PROTEIN: uncharacterized protein LOC107190151 [Dufourea novaeangliae]|uniref:LOW QUALITY PROTEIN: uncharacterized protein LOC107190151 n=1 Tax=Dufourea novaeangliae TaxID=178035 RepID=UPI0007671D6D|nr:PREDICTED: LOW QUALITY PROTEIN: uncharacterized protein LOC107190151 [Dufourea novaeangliae]
MSEAEDASGKVSNLTAVEAISARLAEVTRLAEKLDARLCEAGARTRPVPMSSSAMSSTSSLFSTSSVAPATSVQPISAGISSVGTVNASPLISSSTAAAQIQPKSMSTVLSTTTKSTTTWGSSTSATPTSPRSANGTCIGAAVESVLSPEQQVSMPKTSENDETESENREEFDRIVDGDKQEDAVENYSIQKNIIAGGVVKVHIVKHIQLSNSNHLFFSSQEIIEKSCNNSVGDDSNVECYVTATECSTTPTARSRSESFVTSPECEDLAAPATMTSGGDTWWNIEDPKFITTNAAMLSSVTKHEEISKVPELEKKETLIEISRPKVCEANGEKQVDKFVAVEKRIEEKSGKIVKEVTETTTLRVSHDTRLGVASYKVISNTVQDHRENVDVKEIMDLERIVSPDAHEKTNGYHREPELGSKNESYSRRDELSTKSDDTERVIKFTKICEKNEEHRPLAVTPADTSKDMTLSLKEYTRHHEDSGIEMSPTKRDDSLEGQDFLDKARKVSPIGGPSMNGERNKCCCSCNCSHEAACFDRYAVQQSFVELSSVNENRRRLPLSNAS